MRSSIIAICMLSAMSLFADVALNASLSRSRIYIGESLNLTLEVNGSDAADMQPVIDPPKTEVALLGSQNNSRSSITIINGRMQREIFRGRVFAFQLTPTEAGKFHTGLIRVTIDKKTYTHAGLAFEVVGVEKQNTVIAKINASSTEVLVEEPFKIEIAVAVRDMPEPWGNEHEPIHPQQMPMLTADFLDLNQQQNLSLKGPDLNAILNGLIDQSDRQPGFAINNYQARSMGFGSSFFDDPFKPRAIRFRLPVKREKIDGVPYRVYTITLDYTATKEGEHTFGPITFKGPVITDVQNRQAILKEIYTIGPAVTVRVVPPPEQNRPENFIGSVGKQATATAAFDSTLCKVGDPLTLTLEITGPLSLANMKTPILGLQTNLTHDFRIYDENVKAETLSNGKRFTYRVRPTRAGTLEFPAIHLSYYNSESKKYAPIVTEPIPIQARATTQIATATENEADALASTDVTVYPAGLLWSTLAEQNDPLLPPRLHVITLLLIGPLLCSLAWVIPAGLKLIAKLRSLRRVSGAVHRAQRLTKQAATPADLAHALRACIAERFKQRSGHAYTASDVHDLLIAQGCQDDVARTVRALLEKLDEQMYRPDAADALDDLRQQVLAVLPKLDCKGGAPCHTD